MAQNKNALIRYRTIDKCLQNHYRTWTLEDLIEACSDALYEYEGKDSNVSKRTVQLDIQMLRSDKLGYNAPIEVYERKFYKYTEPNFSITNIPLTENDMGILAETVEVLKQFKDFSLFGELGGIIQKLEDKVYSEQSNRSAVIHLDKNDDLKGLEHLDVLYQAILKKIALTLTYQSFKAREAAEIVFHPFILKEFNNRWFIVGRKSKKDPIMTLALDRIVNIDYNLDVDYLNENFDGDKYYKNTIGVTVKNDESIVKAVLKFDRLNAPYVLTKPLHSTQKVVEKLKDGGVIVKVKVHHNYEFERLILGFGKSVEVLEPSGLRRAIKKNLKKALEVYKGKN